MSQNNFHARTPNPTSYHHADIVDTYTKPKICIQTVRLYSRIVISVLGWHKMHRLKENRRIDFEHIPISFDVYAKKSRHIYKMV